MDEERLELFGEFALDTKRGCLLQEGRPVHLRPQAYTLLAYLAAHRDRLVTKDQLMTAVWDDRAVTDDSLVQCIGDVRRGLGDDKGARLRTVRGRGYILALAPEPPHADQPPAEPSSASPVARANDTRTPESGPAAPAAWPARRVRLAALATAAAITTTGAMLLSRYVANVPLADAPPAAGLPSLRRLTVGRDSYIWPAISPDGRTVAYASDRGGTMEISTARIADVTRELAITTDGGVNIQPAFSSDGRWLAYHSRTRGGVWVVPATGGASRQVADFGSMPAWSPDDETLVFTSDSGGMSSQALLWTVRLDGMGLRALTTLGNPPGGHLSPTWSNDGRWIAFRVGRDAESDVWLVDAAGRTPRRPTAGISSSISRFLPDDRPSPPRFSPDDGAVYWIGNTADGNDCLMRNKVRRPAMVDAGAELLLAFPGKWVSSFSMARDGNAVIALNEGWVNLFAIDVAGDQTATSPMQLTFDAVVNTSPDYGPDGRIAYEQQVSGQPISAWSIDEHGQHKAPISTGLSVSVRAPQWDADARRVFVLVTEPGSADARSAWIDPQTHRLAFIPGPPCRACTPPHLSPDGRRIAFHLIGSDGVMNVWIRHLDDGSERQVTFDSEAIAYPRWSPDGTSLALVIKRGDRTHVGVVSAAGGRVEQLTFGDGQSWPHSFSPDSDRIAFAGERQGVWNIYTVSRTTKQVGQLTHLTTRDGYVRFPAWSPRGNRIVFGRAEREGSLWLTKLP